MLMPWELEDAAKLMLEDGITLADSSLGMKLLEAAKAHIEREAIMGELLSSIPVCDFIARHEDMSRSGRIRLLKDDDGDMGITVIDDSGNSASVEFCIPGTGGGKSPRTHRALQELAVAIVQDNEEAPARAAQR